jgi:hypothetical protein
MAPTIQTIFVPPAITALTLLLVRTKCSQRSRISTSDKRPGPRIEHSQTTITRHPALRSLEIAWRSRSAFRAIFSVQKSVRVDGILHNVQPWLCQKHPCAKITARRAGNTKSGRPGRSRRCKRKRRPLACKPLRSTISGFVSRPRIRLMFSRLCSGVKTSVILPVIVLSVHG